MKTEERNLTSDYSDPNLKVPLDFSQSTSRPRLFSDSIPKPIITQSPTMTSDHSFTKLRSPGDFQNSIDPSISTMIPSLQSPDILGSTKTFTPEITETSKNSQLRTLGQRLQEKFKNLQNEYGRASEPAPESVVQVNQSRFSLPNIISGEIQEAHYIDENSEIDAFEVDLDKPLLRWCAYCNAETTTRSTYSNSTKTFWSAVGIFLMGGVFGCFMIPYMTNKCKDIKYICHKCQHTIN